MNCSISFNRWILHGKRWTTLSLPGHENKWFEWKRSISYFTTTKKTTTTTLTTLPLLHSKARSSWTVRSLSFLSSMDPSRKTQKRRLNLSQRLSSTS
ncbi:hypothetical protein HMI55_005418, partial [Coelomomyces lativittatus]